MTLLLYAIANCSGEQIRGAGLDQRPLMAIGDRSIVAVVSEHQHDPHGSRESAEMMWEYERVVESLMARHTILPARFGTRFDREPAVLEMVSNRHDQLVDALQRVNGAVELSVTATWPDQSSGAADEQQLSGTQYMLGRVELHRRAQAIAAQLAPLSRVARDSSYRLLVNESLPVVGAYLVDHARVDEFAAAVRDVDERLADAALVCTGPWPPYSFAPGAPA